MRKNIKKYLEMSGSEMYQTELVIVNDVKLQSFFIVAMHLAVQQ